MLCQAFVEFDHLGNLWASHVYKGLYKLRLSEDLTAVESIKHYDDNTLANNGSSLKKAFKIENRIVITSGQNLYTYDDLKDSIVLYESLNNALGEYKKAKRIISAGNHQYWFIAEAGIAIYRIDDDSIKKIISYPRSVFRGQMIPTHENVLQLNDSSAFVCLENGFALINTNASKHTNNLDNNTLKLREAVALDNRMNQKKISIDKNQINLPYRFNNLNLRYSFPLKNGEPIYFQYKVDGLYEKWSPLFDKPIFELSRLPAGDYIISVRAINNWLHTSDEHHITLRVDAPWYQTWPAIIVYILITISLFLVSRMITSRKIKLKEKRKRDEKEKELIQYNVLIILIRISCSKGFFLLF